MTLAGDDIQENGIRFVSLQGDSVTSAAEIGGRACRMIQSASGAVKHFYFDVNDDYVYGSRDSEVTISFDYYDEGTEAMEMQYSTAANAFTGVGLGNKTDTKQWLTKTITLNNACFTNAQSPAAYASDFRIKVNTGTLYISNLSVTAGKTTTIYRDFTPTIFLAGDSTCESLPTNYFPREGWGMELAAQFLSDVSVVNQAKGGKSSKSFLSGADPTANPPIEDDGRMEAIQNSAKEGDYLFIQFGHNDRNTSPERYTDPNSTEENSNSYRYNLKQFCTVCTGKRDVSCISHLHS